MLNHMDKIEDLLNGKNPIEPITTRHAILVENLVFAPVKEHGIAALGSGIKSYLDQVKIEPVYLQEQAHNPDLTAMRERLNTMPGIAIANHPGHFDIFLVFNLINRPDFKIMVTPHAYQFFCAMLGAERVLKITADGKDLRAWIRDIREHIDKGGLIFMHPTGGDDAIYSPQVAKGIVFRDGVRVIMERLLRPTDMVYEFWTNPDDIRRAATERFTPKTSGITVLERDRMISVAGIAQPTLIRVNEHFSTAESWQEIIRANPGKDEANQALAQHFSKQFQGQ